MADANYSINIEGREAYNTVASIEKKVEELTTSLKGATVGSEEFAETSKQLQSYKDQLNGITMSAEDMGNNIQKASSGIIGGFQSITGVMSLMGVESESVTKSIERMQALMSLSQGIKGITEGVGAMKKLGAAVGVSTKGLGGFKKALIGTGLGAIVVILGSIIANWEEFTETIGVSQKQMEKLGEVFSGVMNVMKEGIRSIAKSLGRILKGDFSGALDAIKEGFNVTANYQKGVEKEIDDREKKREEDRKERLKEWIELRQKQLDTEASKVKATIDDEKKQLEELIKIEEERLKLYSRGSKEYYDQLLKIKELRKKDEGKEEETPTEPSIDPKKLEKDLKEIEDIRKRWRESTMEEEELELQKLKEKYETEKALMEEYNLSTIELEEEYERNRTDIQTKYQKERDQLMKEELKMRKEGALTLISGFASAMKDIADLIGEESEEAFQASKAFQISSIVLSTITGAVQAYLGAATNAGINAIPLVGPALAQGMGIANAALVTASGVAQIAALSKKKFGDSTVEGLGGAVSGGGEINTSTVSTTLLPPTEYSQELSNAKIEEKVGDSRVYVVESDIRSTTDRVEVMEGESRY